VQTPATVAPATRPEQLSRRLDRYEREQLVRRHAVSLASDIAAVGYTTREIAELLHITDRTLREWRRRVHTDNPLVRLGGRPLIRSPRHDRNAVLGYLDEVGPGLGLCPLRDAFPHMSRAELADLLSRYRRVWRIRHRAPLHVLTWTAPGAVWAMDFAEAPATVDGVGPMLLAVRDLASGYQILWRPLVAATAPATAEALAFLFATHGAPLVLKHDNGGAFTAPPVAQVLHDFGVTPLVSPPYTPSYNGSIEAGIGSLKARTETHAVRHGRHHVWSLDDLAAARLESNAYSRPRGDRGPAPDESWSARTSIPPEDRVSFRHAVEAHRCTVRDERQLTPQGPWSVTIARSVDRDAVSRACVERGLLQFKRTRIPPPIPHRKAEVVP
jgi:transposase InsO family protein